MKIEMGPYPKKFKDKRKIKIKIHNYDAWNADATMTMIILPLLKNVRDQKGGAPGTDDEDAPEQFRSTSAPPRKEEWHTDKNWFKRWNWILDELVWTFGELHRNYDEDYYSSMQNKLTHIWVETDESNETSNRNTPRFYKKLKLTKKLREIYGDNLLTVARQHHSNKVQNGLRLFGKYYCALWT